MNASGESTLPSPPAGSVAEPDPPERLSITLVEEAGDWSGFRSCAAAARKVAAALADHPLCRAARGRHASVVLADDAMLRALNRRYRGKDVPTNVLSFPFQAPPGAGQSCYLGDVILAAETVLREAAGQAVNREHHLQHLLVHGLLHLLGFTHEADADAEAMEGLETEILGTLGIADPYAHPLHERKTT
jgi:probable rRNA maturation factor